MEYQGIIWEKGTHAGKIILFPANNRNEYFCIGTEEYEEPSLLVSGGPFYFYVDCGDDELIWAADTEETVCDSAFLSSYTHID